MSWNNSTISTIAMAISTSPASNDGVKFTSYVGVIQIGGLTLEILPKTDRQTHYDPKRLRYLAESAFPKMLVVCQRIRVDAASEASLSRRHNSLLDLYFDPVLR
jgi:5-methylcytosine-specific restriction enzyme subunit McrC